MNLIVLFTEAFARIKHIVSKFETEVKDWNPQVSPSLIQQILYSLLSDKFEIVIDSLL